MSEQRERQAAARLELARHIADYLAQMDAAGFAVLTLEMVDRLRDVDREAYVGLNAGIVAHVLGHGALRDRPGSFRDALTDLKCELAAGKAEKAAVIAESMGQWVTYIEAVAAGVAPDQIGKVQVM